MENLILFLIFMTLGYGVGTLAEKRHYKSIRRREKDFLHLPAVTLKTAHYTPDQVAEARLVYGSAVISIDYFKKILAGLRNIFGGTVKSYESLVDRARREATLRMKAMAGDAAVIVNVRIETAAVGKQANRKSVGCLEAIAYGTAITLKQ